MADMSYVDKLATLGQMSDSDLSKFQNQVKSAFQDADANDDLVAMSAAAEALETISSVMNSRTGDTSNDVENLAGQPENADGTTQISNTPIAASAADGETEDEPDAEVEPEEDDDEVVEEDAEPDADADEGGSEGEVAPDAGDASVTAAGLPPALKAHEFKKKGAKAAPADDAEDEDDDEAVTAASVQGDSTEDIPMPVEQKDIPAERRPLVASATAPVVSAGADAGIPAGTVYTTERELSTAFVKRLDAFRGARGAVGDKVTVATVTASVTDDARMLNDRDSSEVNADKIDAVVRGMKTMGPGSDAIVASGGYCAPLEVRYNIFGVGVTDRPVRDSLAGFQATRGGIRYVQPPVLSSFSGAVGLWTASNDANPSNPATKPFLTAVCQSAIDVTLDAITLEIQFGNLMTRAYPELVARNNELGLIYQARFAEQTLLSKISAQSTAVTASWVLGTARDMLNSIGRLAAAYRARHRLNADDALRVIAPAWARDAIREDLTRGLPVALEDANLAITDAYINAFLASRNINITWHLDDSLETGPQATGNINDFPAYVRYWIFAEGTFLFLDGGTLDLGIVRDSTLVGTNDYRMFVETFEGLAKVGIESIQATVITHITGAHVGTVTPS